MTQSRTTPDTILRVASNSDPANVAGAIVGVIRDHGDARLQAIGAGAINQTVKAIAIARGYMAPGGIDLACIPYFVDLDISGDERTAVGFRVFKLSTGGRSAVVA